jgi:hypothetical protein
MVRKVNSISTGDIRKDLTEKQLAGIGAVAIAYNETEALLDVILARLLGLPPELSIQVTSRIHGIDGKIELIKIWAKDLNAPCTLNSLLSHTLGNEGKTGFSLIKKYRDHVAHARAIDAPTGMAKTPGKRGKTLDVLLTVNWLEAIYLRIVAIQREMEIASEIAFKLHALFGQPKSQLEPEIREHLVQYQQHQKHRLSLPPLPEFPSELEILQSHLQWQKDRQAPLMDWYQQLSQPLPRPHNRWLDAATHSVATPLSYRAPPEDKKK